MKKELLNEIHRTREIMGLGIIMEQEENKVAQELIAELIEVFKSTPKEEREELKITILKGLKKNGTEDEIIQAANKKMEEFLGLEEVVVDEDGDDETVAAIEEQIELSNPFKGPTHRSSSSDNAYSKYSGRRAKCSGAKNTYAKAICMLKKLIKVATPLGIEIWAGGENYINIPIRKGRIGKKAKLNSLEETQPETPQADWQEYYDKYNKKFVRRIKAGKEIWKAAWEKEEGKYKAFVIDALEEFNKFRKENKGKVSIRVTDKPKKTIQQGDIIPSPIVQFQFPVDGGPDAQYFVDNCYKILPKFAEQIDLLIAEVVKSAQGKQAPKGKKQFWLGNLEIISSCSAVPNGKTCGETTLSKAMTFPELAAARGNAAKDYLMEKLKEINCGFGPYNDEGDETQITINSKGDGTLPGTSGPDWNPEYAKYIKPWKESGQKTIVSDDNAEELKKNKVNVNEINSIFAQYEKAKKCEMGLAILVNTQDVGEEDREPDEIIFTDKLAVTMNRPGRSPWDFGFGWRWPKIRFKPFTNLTRFFRKIKNRGRCNY